MFSALIFAVAVASASPSMARAQCPCYPNNDDINDMICEDTSLTSIPNCVANNVTTLSIRTPSIPLVAETIRRFTNLYRLNIDHFENPQVSKTFLSSQKNLSYFQIYRTGLDYVDNDWFFYAPHIRILVLSYNKIRSLSEDTFRSLPGLRTAYLNSNQLSTLPPTLFQGTSLGNVYVHDNPWNCDCELATFVQWTRDNRAKVENWAYCLHPSELEGLNIQDLTMDHACNKDKNDDGFFSDTLNQ